MLLLPFALAALVLPQASPVPVVPAPPPDVFDAASGYWFRVEPGGANLTVYHATKKGFRVDIASQCGKDSVPIMGVLVRDEGPPMVTNTRGLMADVDVARGTLGCANPDTDAGVVVGAWGEDPPFPVMAHRGGKSYGFKTNAGACRFLGCEATGQSCLIMETYPGRATCSGVAAAREPGRPANAIVKPRDAAPAFMASGFMLLKGRAADRFPPELPLTFMLTSDQIVRPDGKAFGLSQCANEAPDLKATDVIQRARLEGRVVVAEFGRCELRVSAEGAASCACRK